MRTRLAVAAIALTLLPAASAAQPTTTFAVLGGQAQTTLVDVLYAGQGQWNQCGPPGCGVSNRDWGVDSLTYALYLRWTATHDPSLQTILRTLIATSPSYGQACASRPCGWSDVPEWDAIASVREYQATHDPRALAKAEAAFAYVEDAKVFAVGACPAIRYQQPDGEANKLKTLETDANAIKAALLLYAVTRNTAYLDSARTHYASVRAYFLDPFLPLYSVYVFDDGTTCTQVPHRFFASVNGDMIWNGVELWRDTQDSHYLDEAVATATAIRRLDDSADVFTDLQAENDIVEPLVEGMLALAQQRHDGLARNWILRNGAAALSARAADGTYGRFFDGPPARAMTTAWQTNGGLALAFAAAALAPKTRVATAESWAGARTVTQPLTTADSVTFTGSAIALLGTLGEHCCENGHARVFVDGVETVDGTGIWQNKSSSGRSLPNTVLFAWRWPQAGTHTITFAPGEPNAKEGNAFLDLSGYVVR
jgi:hypothetical protein